MEELTEKIDFYKDGTDFATDMPLWKFILLLVVTFGLYQFVWIYFNLRLFDFINKRESYALFIAIITALIPSELLLYIVLFYLYYNILKLNYKNNIINFVLVIILISFIYFMGNAAENLLEIERPIYWLFIFLGLVPTITMQHLSNKYFKKNKL